MKSNGTANKVIAEKYGLLESTISTINNKDNSKKMMEAIESEKFVQLRKRWENFTNFQI